MQHSNTSLHPTFYFSFSGHSTVTVASPAFTNHVKLQLKARLLRSHKMPFVGARELLVVAAASGLALLAWNGKRKETENPPEELGNLKTVIHIMPHDSKGSGVRLSLGTNVWLGLWLVLSSQLRGPRYALEF